MHRMLFTNIFPSVFSVPTLIGVWRHLLWSSATLWWWWQILTSVC